MHYKAMKIYKESLKQRKLMSLIIIERERKRGVVAWNHMKSTQKNHSSIPHDKETMF